MSELQDQKIRFSAVAHATGIAPKTLRNWEARKDLIALKGADVEGWRTFSLVQVAHLAVIPHFVKFGIDVEYADKLAYNAVHLAAGLRIDGDVEPFLERLSWFVTLVSEAEGEIRGVRLRREHAELDLDKLDSMLIVNAAPIVRRAFERLAAFQGGDRDKAEGAE